VQRCGSRRVKQTHLSTEYASCQAANFEEIFTEKKLYLGTLGSVFLGIFKELKWTLNFVKSTGLACSCRPVIAVDRACKQQPLAHGARISCYCSHEPLRRLSTRYETQNLEAAQKVPVRRTPSEQVATCDRPAVSESEDRKQRSSWSMHP